MSNLKRFTNLNEMTTVTPPVEASELDSRQTDYLLLSPSKFATKYRDVLFRPVRFTFDRQDFDIQVNGCTNPFCKWFGLPQKRFEDVKNKPSRYKHFGSDTSESKSIVCNPDPTGSKVGMTWNCSNFNPKYAQYVVTFLRTYYNFCVAYKSGGKRLTPAQRLGIADKQYDLKDIVYFS